MYRLVGEAFDNLIIWHCWYFNNLLLIWLVTKQDLENFFLNAVQLNLTFTKNWNEVSIDFLDLTLCGNSKTSQVVLLTYHMECSCNSTLLSASLYPLYTIKEVVNIMC